MDSENIVRFLDACVDSLDLSELVFILAQDSVECRPTVESSVFLKLFLMIILTIEFSHNLTVKTKNIRLIEMSHCPHSIVKITTERAKPTKRPIHF